MNTIFKYVKLLIRFKVLISNTRMLNNKSIKHFNKILHFVKIAITNHSKFEVSNEQKKDRSTLKVVIITMTDGVKINSSSAWNIKPYFFNWKVIYWSMHAAKMQKNSENLFQNIIEGQLIIAIKWITLRRRFCIAVNTSAWSFHRKLIPLIFALSLSLSVILSEKKNQVVI